VPVFPVLDKTPDVNIVKNYNDSTISSPMDSGLEITRARFTRIRREWQISYRNALQSDEDALDAFIRTVTIGMAASFQWTHPVTGETVTVRFSQLPTPIDAGFITNSKLIAAGADPASASGQSYSFTFKVREV
jgi:hypothetical protein